MMRRTRQTTIGILASLGLALFLHGSASLAQTQRTGSADARMQQQLQQLSNERIALQAENARLKQELEQLKKDLDKTSAARSTLEKRAHLLEATASRGEASGKQAEEQLERARAQMQELIAKFRETAQSLRDVETQHATTKTQLAMREREIKTCIDRNAGLYNLNVEVLDRMDDRGFWSALSQREPFTQLKRVQLENLIDDYKYRADELRLEQEKKEQSTAQRRLD
jgi:uncharacterized protein YlxW (UPF0749 family)